MDKITYLAELAEGLARWVPERERQDILRWYAEYFEEAGPEREAEVVAELGDPWALSSRLAVEGGYVTWEKAASWRPGKRWPKVLLGAAVGLTVFALVFGVGLLAVNVTRAVSYSEQDPVLFGEVEQVTVVDWTLSPAWGYDHSVIYADNMGGSGVYFLEGENVAPFRSIDVDISLGNIEVVAGDGCNMSVGYGDAMCGYEPVWEIRDGVLRLRDGNGPRGRVGGWDDLKKLFGANQLAVDITIMVPPNAVLDGINVKTGLGDVLLYGVAAETVTADTGLGNVECYEARNVRRLELTTGMGDVDLRLVEALDGLYIGLKTGMGDVEAALCGFETDYSYALESGMGSVAVNGIYQNTKVERRGNKPYQLSAASGMGSVNVYFTSN